MTTRHLPPKEGVTFTRMWNVFIDDVTQRNDFHKGHLQFLEVLCDLYEEYAQIMDVLEMCGSTYESEGRNGFQVKPRPEVAQKNKIVDQIAAMTRLLNLVPNKNKEAPVKPEQQEEWA